MVSHLNAHNMPGATDRAEGSGATAGKRLLWAAVGILGFFLLDRASLLFIPEQYHGVPDVEQYHTLYYSLKFQQFDRVKGHLDTIVVGDSRARHGVDPALLEGQSDESRVTAFNFAPASSGIEFTDILAHEYFCDLPRLRTIVWGLSPRVFNRYWQDPVCELFVESRGYKSDRLAGNKGSARDNSKAAVRLGTCRILGGLSAAFAHRSKLRSILLDGLAARDGGPRFHAEPAIDISEWGFMEFPESQVVDVANGGEVEKILESLESGRFELDRERLRKFRALIGFLEQRNIRLVCFVPPMHHSLMQSDAADTDGTPDEDYDRLMAALKEIEKEFVNYRLIDLHRGGDNGFANGEYGDFDHVNRAGSQKLSRLVAEQLRSICAKPLAPAAAAANSRSETSPRSPASALRQSGSDRRELGTSSDKDKTPPKICSHLGDLDYMVGAFPPDNRPLIWAEYSDERSDINTESVRLFMDGKDITANCKITGGRISFKPAKTLKAPKLYMFKAVVSDSAGNKSELVWEILLKPC